MAHGRVLIDGRDGGSAFTLAPRVALTAGHVVRGRGAAEVRFRASSGAEIGVGSMTHLADLDVAVLLLDQDAPAVLTAGIARDGQQWQIEARPLGNDPRLSGLIDTARRPVMNAGGHRVDVIQLQVDQRLGNYEGYSGAAVTLSSDPSTAVGVLVEQVLADRIGFGAPGPASNVLYAVPVGTVLQRVGLAESVAWRWAPTGLADRHDVTATLRAQLRAADELPYQVFGARRRPLSSVYVRRGLADATAGPAAPSGLCRVEDVLARHRHVILVGGPGQGKSTLTLQLVRHLAQGRLTGAPHVGVEPVPLRVTARELAKRTHLPWARALVEAASADLGSYLDADDDLSADLLRAEVAGAPWLVVVDGLDEVVEPEHRDKLIAILARRLADAGAPHRLLITSRPPHPAELASLRQHSNDLAVYELEPLGAEALEELARRWSPTNDSPADDFAARFLAEARNAGIMDVLSVPLLAVMAMVLFEQDPDGVLPQYRYDLYERYLDRALTTSVRLPEWRALTARLAGVAGTAPDLASLEELLRHLATAQIDSDASLATSADRWLRRTFSRTTRYPPDWDAIVDTLLSRTGLLVRRGDRWEFIHHSFAEHLAAAAGARVLPSDFWPNAPEWRRILERATDWHAGTVARLALLHWCRASSEVATPLLTWLQEESWRYQELAAVLLTTGVEGTPAHLDAARATVERQMLLLDEGQPTWLLGRLARRHPPALAALDRIAANPMVPTWTRADARAHVVALRELTADQAADMLRQLLAERRSDAGWSHVFAGAGLLRLGNHYRAEAIGILQAVLADPYAHPDARESAAYYLIDAVPEHRPEALATLRAIVADPLAEYFTQQFLTRTLAKVGFAEEAAAALDAIIANPDAGHLDKVRTSYAYESFPPRYRATAIATFRTMADDPTMTAEVRQQAASALARLAPDQRAHAVDVLRRLLADPACEAKVRATAAETIGSFAPDLLDAVAIEQLRAVLGDANADPWIRIWSARAMARLDFERYDEAVAGLRQMARLDPRPEQRVAGAYGLAQLGPSLQMESADALRALVALTTAGLSTRILAAGYLGEVDPARRDEAIALLGDLVTAPTATSDDLVQGAGWLLRLQPAAVPEAVEWLTRVVTDPTASAGSRAEAADHLVQLDAAHRDDGIATLRAVIADPNTADDIRGWASQRLLRCDRRYREEAMAMPPAERERLRRRVQPGPRV